jgi:hypothetical protein
MRMSPINVRFGASGQAMDSYDTVFENLIFPLQIGVSAEHVVLGGGRN